MCADEHFPSENNRKHEIDSRLHWVDGPRDTSNRARGSPTSIYRMPSNYDNLTVSNWRIRYVE